MKMEVTYYDESVKSFTTCMFGQIKCLVSLVTTSDRGYFWKAFEKLVVKGTVVVVNIIQPVCNERNVTMVVRRCNTTLCTATLYTFFKRFYYQKLSLGNGPHMYAKEARWQYIKTHMLCVPCETAASSVVWCLWYEFHSTVWSHMTKGCFNQESNWWNIQTSFILWHLLSRAIFLGWMLKGRPEMS